MLSFDLAVKLIPCACGCGKMIEPTDKKGRSKSFLPGHNSRVKHPMLGQKAKNNKGGIITKWGYKLIYVPLEEREYHTCKSDGYAFEHRYIMEKHLGRKLKKNEVVHHVNGDKLDNRIENLRLMNIEEHAEFESNIRPINWDAIEAMRQVNTAKPKTTCIVDECNNKACARLLCNKHYHLYRRSLLFVIGGRVIIVKNERKEPKLREKKCKQCGATYLPRSNRRLYCDDCRKPYEFVKRYRARKKRGVN